MSTAALNLLLAIMLANLPFVRPLSPRGRHDFFGWIVCYAVWIAISLLLQSVTGKATPTSWEVWAVTTALFAVLAFPGIVWRHLLKD
jgi:hypothetical protein